MPEKVPGIDLDRLTPWFAEHVAPVDSLTAEVIGHGRSNLTYRLNVDGRDWVLRRPPLSHVLPTAHDMKREFRVISALKDTDVPVPEAIALCEDTSVNDAPFYIMEYVSGLVPVDAAVVANRYDEGERRRIGEELIDTMVKLHAVDPASVGLGEFGKPQGYVERQVRRFIDQLSRSKTREIPELDELARRLLNAVPTDSEGTIVHGDFRLDNCILGDDGHIAAVLDWEMATLGDPLADLGILMMYWSARGGDGATQVSVGANSVIGLPGFPTRDEAVARYAERSGRHLGNLDFYVALAHFKLAVIVEGIHKRFLEGGTVGAGFEAVGAQALALSRAGLAIADQSEMEALRG
jgi:aminoglycoside phosphotransferase (APT) family kinase protein